MSFIGLINYVINQNGAPALYESTLATRPAAGLAGRIFIATDTLVIQRDTGTTWQTIGGGGSAVTGITGTANQVLVNGTSGSEHTGSITLTLPQSIDTSSSPVFTGITVSGLTNGQLIYTSTGGLLKTGGISYSGQGVSLTSAITTASGNGLLIQNSLTAQANGDQQTGLGIRVTFSDGAYTGVNHYSLQIAGNGYMQLGGNVGPYALPTNGSGLQIGWNKSNGGGETSLWFNKSAGSSGGMYIGENVAGTGTYYAKFISSTGNLILQSGGTYTDLGAPYNLQVSGSIACAGFSGSGITYTTSQTLTRNAFFYVYGSAATGAGTFTLFNSSGNNQLFAIKNNSTYTLTIQSYSGTTILTPAGGNVSLITIAAGATSLIISGGGSNFIQLF